MDGRAVRARGGEREEYRPLASRLCPDGRAETLVAALRRRYPIRRLYLADLDAIRGSGAQEERIRALQRSHPDLELWVDAGIGDERSLDRLLDHGLTPVLGSETLPGTDLLEVARERCQPVLSLDYLAEAFQGPPGLERDPARWPGRVVAMTLARVGAGRGPDLAALERIRSLKPEARLYAAGGVRDGADLERLAGLGADGALVASALHEGRLDAWLGREA